MSLTRDTIIEAMTDALRRMNDDIETRGWDQPASLWVVRREITEDDILLSISLAVSPNMFAMEHPPELLAQIADAAEEYKVGAGENVFAFVFVSEAWMVEGPEAIRAADPGGLHEHPDRIEIRSIVAVDIAGFRYTHNFARETRERMEMVTRRGEGTNFSSGYIFESLTRLVNATLQE